MGVGTDRHRPRRSGHRGPDRAGSGALTPGESDCYVVYGTAPWDAPWLTEHNLARALGERHTVLYVEPPITPLTPFRRRELSEVRTELRALARRGVRPSAGLHVFRPVAVPPREHVRVRAATAPVVRAQLRRAVDRIGLRRPVVVAARDMLELSGAVGERLRVYLVKDLIEAGDSLLGLTTHRLATDVAAMCRTSDVVCATSLALHDSLAERGIANTHLPHGFHADLAPLYDSAAEPPEYASLPRPILGYTGRVDARLDFDLIRALAARFQAASVVLVGPVSPRLPRQELAALRAHPNVHLLGARPRAELPGYIRHLDCCLMPYRDSEWIRHASPLKLWDYLYAGPRIVGAGCPALREHPPPLVEFAASVPDFLGAVEGALAAPREGFERRREYALANSWSQRARRLERLVTQAGPGAPHPASPGESSLAARAF